MTVLVVRSYPADRDGKPPQGHIEGDGLERVLTTEYDYRPVRDRLLRSDAAGVINLDWDIALGREDLRAMVASAETYSATPFVLPYRLYGHGGVWAHRWRGQWVTERHVICDTPGWGAIYLPRNLLEWWEPTPADPRLTDQNFGAWLEPLGRPLMIDWRFRPVHLHYSWP